jgi:hypothetical protein
LELLLGPPAADTSSTLDNFGRIWGLPSRCSAALAKRLWSITGALLGEDAAGHSASAIGRLRDGWQDDHAAWQKCDLSARRYVYVWADGIYLQARLADEKQCILVLIGATPEDRQGARRVQRWCEEKCQRLA